jgi:hypothetical protein
MPEPNAKDVGTTPEPDTRLSDLRVRDLQAILSNEPFISERDRPAFTPDTPLSDLKVRDLQMLLRKPYTFPSEGITRSASGKIDLPFEVKPVEHGHAGLELYRKTHLYPWEISFTGQYIKPHWVPGEGKQHEFLPYPWPPAPSAEDPVYPVVRELTRAVSDLVSEVAALKESKTE